MASLINSVEIKIGNLVIDSDDKLPIEIDIGDLIIDRYDSEWLDVWNELIKESERENSNEIHNKKKEDNLNEIRNKKKTYISTINKQ